MIDGNKLKKIIFIDWIFGFFFDVRDYGWDGLGVEFFIL